MTVGFIGFMRVSFKMTQGSCGSKPTVNFWREATMDDFGVPTAFLYAPVSMENISEGIPKIGTSTEQGQG
jgi:hypothetical protein